MGDLRRIYGLVTEAKKGKKPKAGSGARFKKLEKQLASEGGPGSGPKPGQKKSKAVVAKSPQMPDMADDMGPSDDTDAPAGPGAAGVPASVASQLRDIIQQLERIVPDDDAEGDEPDLDAPDDQPDDVEQEAVQDPAALAASIGRRKYGKDRFQKMAAAGRRRRS